MKLTVKIVDSEEEFELVVGRLSCELLHGSQELGERHGAAHVPVEDLENAFGEERLKWKWSLFLSSV